MRISADERTSAFRGELEAWLDANLPPASAVDEARRSSAHLTAWGRRWQRQLFDAGWLVPGWPPGLGGRDATAEEQLVYFEVLAERQVPRSLNPQGLSICAPSIRDHGTDEQRATYLVPTLRAEIAWCLGMSEPGAGSDLAALATRAERVGEAYVVNGQKVWTSGARDADHCLCFVRTDPEAPKHRGISVLLVDMATPGISVRPLPELTDPAHADFAEVFFTDVEVPASALLGRPGEGWRLAQGSLGHERSMLWIMNATKLTRTLRGLLRLAAEPDGTGSSRGEDPVFAAQVAQAAIDAQAVWCLGNRGVAKTLRGEPAPEHVLLKLFSSEAEQRACLLGTEIQGAGALDVAGPGPLRGAPGTDVGPWGAAVDPAWVNAFDAGPWVTQYLRTFSGTIAGGTSEIQRSIIAERVLGLPR